MPTYEYKCNECEHEFEEFQSIMARPIKKCPKCGKLRVKRLIGCGSAVIFKGSGFYETDYRSESYTKAQKAEKDSVKSAEKPAEKSADKKKKGSDAKKSVAKSEKAKS